MNKYTLHRDNVASTKYRLVAVVTHSGDMKRGHYAAYVQRVQDHRNTSWYFVSDDVVKPVSKQQVSTANPVLLFFELDIEAADERDCFND